MFWDTPLTYRNPQTQKVKKTDPQEESNPVPATDLVSTRHFAEFQIFNHLFNVIGSTLKKLAQACFDDLRTGFHNSPWKKLKREHAQMQFISRDTTSAVDVTANRKHVVTFYLSIWLRWDMTVSYLASKDLERICRQFTTAPASVPESSTTKMHHSSGPPTQTHWIHPKDVHFSWSPNLYVVMLIRHCDRKINQDQRLKKLLIKRENRQMAFLTKKRNSVPHQSGQLTENTEVQGEKEKGTEAGKKNRARQVIGVAPKRKGQLNRGNCTKRRWEVKSKSADTKG